MKGNVKLTAQVLELLGNGFVLAYVRNDTKRRIIHKECDRIWHEIDRKQLYQVLDRLKLGKFIETIKDNNRAEKIKVTNSGKYRILKNSLENIKVKHPKHWDGKYRIIFYDIPENKKKIRDALRRKLKEIGFVEFQKSVFVFPYPCKEEIDFIINFWDIAECVYYIESKIYPDKKLRQKFKL